MDREYAKDSLKRGNIKRQEKERMENAKKRQIGDKDNQEKEKGYRRKTRNNK